MKPSWDEAPSWAMYLAMDANEAWYWYEEEPHMIDSGWLSFHGRVKRVVSYHGDWRDAKEKRT